MSCNSTFQFSIQIEGFNENALNTGRMNFLEKYYVFEMLNYKDIEDELNQNIGKNCKFYYLNYPFYEDEIRKVTKFNDFYFIFFNDENVVDAQQKLSKLQDKLWDLEGISTDYKKFDLAFDFVVQEAIKEVEKKGCSKSISTLLSLLSETNDKVYFTDDDLRPGNYLDRIKTLHNIYIDFKKNSS